jgi:hypothetical protein
MNVPSFMELEGSLPYLQDVLSGSHGGEYEDDLSSGMLRRVVWQKFTDVFRGAYCLHHHSLPC